MTRDIRDNTSHYIVLGMILAFGLLAFSYFNYDFLLQRMVAATIGILYIFWGIGHHIMVDKITSKIVLEYCLVALLGYLIINGLLIGR